METIKSYRVRATSTIARSGVAAAQGVELPISFSAPPEFKGVAGHWTPEHFFVAAVASCYVSTFRESRILHDLSFYRWRWNPRAL